MFAWSKISSRRGRRQPSSGRRLKLESLEHRELMSASPLEGAGLADAAAMFDTSSARATRLVAGGIASASIRAAGQTATFTYTSTGKETIQLIMASSGQSGFAPVAKLYDPSGYLVDQFDSMSDRPPRSLSKAGQWVIKVTDQDLQHTGSVSIGLETLVPPSRDAKSLPSGGIVSGRINTQIQKDQLLFYATANSRVQLMMTSSGAAGFAAVADVWSPEGRFIASLAPNQELRLSLGQQGYYIVEVRDEDFAHTGDYTVGLESIVPPSADAVRIQLGSTTSGNISTAIQKNQYLLQVSGPKGVSFRLTSGGQSGYKPVADVYSNTGDFVMRFSSDSPPPSVNLSGSYIIQVRDEDYAHGGSYTLSATPTVAANSTQFEAHATSFEELYGTETRFRKR